MCQLLLEKLPHGPHITAHIHHIMKEKIVRFYTQFTLSLPLAFVIAYKCFTSAINKRTPDNILLFCLWKMKVHKCSNEMDLISCVSKPYNHHTYIY